MLMVYKKSHCFICFVVQQESMSRSGNQSIISFSIGEIKIGPSSLCFLYTTDGVIIILFPLEITIIITKVNKWLSLMMFPKSKCTQGMYPLYAFLLTFARYNRKTFASMCIIQRMHSVDPAMNITKGTMYWPLSNGDIFNMAIWLPNSRNRLSDTWACMAFPLLPLSSW